METTGHGSSDSPSDNNVNPSVQSALLKAKRSALTQQQPVYDAFEQFLQAFFVQHNLNEAAQLTIRDSLSRNLINSLYSLSRSSPSTLILAGLPALFVDECTRAAVFVPDSNNIKPFPDPALKSGPSPRWEAVVDMEPAQTPQLGRFPSNSHRGLNWSLHEILVLLDSIKRDDVAANKAGIPKKFQCAEDRWETVSQYCSQRDVHKSAQQCLRKWEKLISYFKKIYDYEKRHATGFDSFWHLSRHERKQRSLPISFNRDVYDAMVNKLQFDQATNSGNFFSEFPYMGGDQLNGDAEQLPEDTEEESVSFSSEHQQTNGRSKKHERSLPSLLKDMPENSTGELVDRFKRIESKRQQVDRERLACDEKRSQSLCTSITEIATAIRSIAHVIEAKHSG